MMLKRLILTTVVILQVFGQCSREACSQNPGEAWIDLFPNSSLAAWTRTNTPPETWSFENGVLICSGKPIGELRTRRMFQNFIMEVEWRHMVPGGNAGIFVWADDITAKGVPFHRGIEIQVLENDYGNTRSHTTHGDIFPIHGATMKPVNGRGGSRAFPTENRSKPSPQWNHYRIVANNGAISLAVNGKVVTQGEECWPRRGYICLESEGGVVQYRNVRLQVLPGTKISNSDVAINDRGYVSVYSGLDLRGWKVDGVGVWKSNDWVLSYEGPTAEWGSLEFTGDQNSNGFLFDFRCKNEQSGVEIIGLADRPINPMEPPFSSSLSSSGQWNRLELFNSAAGLIAKLNGEMMSDFTDQDALSTAKNNGVCIKAKGKVDFANLYQRRSDASETKD